MTLKDDSPMPFGKYSKTDPPTLMANIPADYLLWLYDGWKGQKPFGEAAQAVERYIIDNMDALKLETK